MQEELLLESLRKIGKNDKWREFANFIDNGARGAYVILRYLRDSATEVVAGDLAKAMGVTTARIARALKTLEKKGYIKRKKSEVDGRKVTVSLTPLGLNALEKRERDIRSTLLPWLDRLSDDEQNELLRLLYKLFQ